MPKRNGIYVQSDSGAWRFANIAIASENVENLESFSNMPKSNGIYIQSDSGAWRSANIAIASQNSESVKSCSRMPKSNGIYVRHESAVGRFAKTRSWLKFMRSYTHEDASSVFQEGSTTYAKPQTNVENIKSRVQKIFRVIVCDVPTTAGDYRLQRIFVWSIYVGVSNIRLETLELWVAEYQTWWSLFWQCLSNHMTYRFLIVCALP